MSELGLRPRMLVKDVMTSPVVTIGEEGIVHETAKLMDKNDLGCIIVTDKKGKPVGIITERDLITRVMSKNLLASKVKAKKVMTSPLLTIDPDEPLAEAARKMSRLNVRRLGVIYKGNLVGLVSSKDILAVTPELLETIQEQAKLQKEPAPEEEAPEPRALAGYCDHCGRWSDALKDNDGQLLCEECQVELKGEY
ncbi:MAG TPA: CBS domain-containing protein [Candidatus Bathyarchaeia archaeon]|nr:CBS domain-containing protein [Candidatus Bathyarchaeia archaeon]